MRRYWRAFLDGLWWRRKTVPTTAEITQDLYMLALTFALVLWLDWWGLVVALVLCTLIPLAAGFWSAWLAEKAGRPLWMDFTDTLDSDGSPWPEPVMPLSEALRPQDESPTDEP